MRRLTCHFEYRLFYNSLKVNLTAEKVNRIAARLGLTSCEGKILKSEKTFVNGAIAKCRYPAFYNLGSLFMGLQIGGENSEIILMTMTDRGMVKLLTSSFKLGADLSGAVSPVGAGGRRQNRRGLFLFQNKRGFRRCLA